MGYSATTMMSLVLYTAPHSHRRARAIPTGSWANDGWVLLLLLLLSLLLPAVAEDDGFLLLSVPLAWLLDAVAAAVDGAWAVDDDDDTFTAVAGVVVVVVVAADMAIVVMTGSTTAAAAAPDGLALVVPTLLLLIEAPAVSAVPERLFTVASLPTPPTVVADGVVTVGVAVVVLLLPLAVHVRSVVSPEVDCPSCFAASLPGLSGALGCPSSGEGAIVRFRLRFHNRPVAEVYSAPR